MKKKQKGVDWQDLCAKGIVGIVVTAVLYYVVALSVFHFRHPWATEMEDFLHTWDALNFRRIPYDAMRPR